MASIFDQFSEYHNDLIVICSENLKIDYNLGTLHFYVIFLCRPLIQKDDGWIQNTESMLSNPVPTKIQNT